MCVKPKSTVRMISLAVFFNIYVYVCSRLEGGISEKFLQNCKNAGISQLSERRREKRSGRQLQVEPKRGWVGSGEARAPAFEIRVGTDN
jgi:hypothetical protein